MGSGRLDVNSFRFNRKINSTRSPRSFIYTRTVLLSLHSSHYCSTYQRRCSDLHPTWTSVCLFFFVFISAFFGLYFYPSVSFSLFSCLFVCLSVTLFFLFLSVCISVFYICLYLSVYKRGCVRITRLVVQFWFLARIGFAPLDCSHS